MFKRRTRYLAAGALASVLLTSLFGGMISTYAYKTEFEERALLQLKEFNDYEAAILSDFALLKSKNIFPLTHRSKNALQTLKPHVGFVNSSSEIADDQRIRDFLIQFGRWSKKQITTKQLLLHSCVSLCDTAWVDELQQYDHLNLFSDPIYNDIAYFVPRLHGIDRVAYHDHLPVFNWPKFRTLVLISILKKMARSPATRSETLAELRHVAHLVQSNPAMTSQLVSIALLRNEVVFAELFNVEQKNKLTSDDIDRIKRLAFAWKDLVSLNDYSGFPESLKPFLEPRFMVCGGVELNRGHIFFSDMFEETWPFERNFAKQIADSRSLYLELYKKCGLTVFTPFLTSQDKNLNLSDDSTKLYPVKNGPDADNFSHIWLKLPYFKKVVASSLRGQTASEKMILYAPTAKVKPAHLKIDEL